MLRETLHAAIARLTAEHVPSPRLNAELLLMFVLDVDRAYLYAHDERQLTPEEQSRYEEALARRAQGIPAQYITGHQEFWGLDFIVTPAVLIPRPETEHLIETVLDLSKALKHCHPERSEGPALRLANDRLRMTNDAFRLADVGTGSGCIAIALAKELPLAEIHATDVSPAALEVARANAVRHEADRIQFHETDLIKGLPQEYFDLVVSNPPYVGESEEDEVQLEVRKFEPRKAVFAGHKGLEVIERLLPQSYAALKPGGWLVMEISGTIAQGVRGLLKGWEDVELTSDLQGIPRVARARKPISPTKLETAK